ncbi:hypothetical protein ACFPA8_26260 [Streptomyces ovatisporus]|uniref:ATP-binding protein n=1 Tax=Streptomyces ovatisporus TaxID=1128682 RepID=A0ABV9AGT3_9ACTN
MPASPPAAAERGARSVVIDGDNKGIVSTGDFAFNVFYAEGRFVETESLRELPLHEAPLLPASGRTELFGRDELVEEVSARLAEGTSVQLYGEPGVGKRAIAEAVHRRLAEQGGRGHVLSPLAGETGTLELLYRRLAEAFFGKPFLREVDETVLRAAVAGVSGVHITVFDSELGREDLARVLETFPGCTFLFTSPYATLPDSRAAHHVQPLPRAAAVELLSAGLGLSLGPEGLRNLQFDHVYEMSEGRPQRLLQYAEFIKGSDAWRAGRPAGPHDKPPPVDPARLNPRHQAEALAVALSEPARRVLVALATFKAPMSPDWFAPVTGDPQAAGTGPELHDRRLVTCRYGVYQITEEAAAAVRAQDWPAAPAATAAEGLTAALAAEDRAPAPEPYLLLTVARALRDAQQWVLVARFVRAAAPVALAAGRGQVALQLYGLGRIAAGRGGLSKDLRYYVKTEEQTRDLLAGDKLAVVAALALLSAPVAPTAKLGGLVSWAAKFTSTKVAVTAGAATVAVGAAVAVTVATSGSDVPAGCAEAQQAMTDQREPADIRLFRDLAGEHRKVAGALEAAAAEATEGKVESALRTRAQEREKEAASAESEGDGGLSQDVHPDVIAAQTASRATLGKTRDYLVISPVCPNVRE